MLRPEYVCDRCGCSIPARLIEGADSYIPECGDLILSPVVGGDEDGFLPLCDRCIDSPHSWPWWAEWGMSLDESQCLASAYDADFHPEDIPVTDRFWN